MLLLYVDDVYLVGNHSDQIEWLRQELLSRFEMTDLGLLSYFLGVEFIQRPIGLILTQRGYLQQILTKFEMSHCNLSRVPVQLGIKLQRNMNAPTADLDMYQCLVGKLLFCNLTSLMHLLYSVVSLLLPRNPISLPPNIFFATSRALFLWVSSIV